MTLSTGVRQTGQGRPPSSYTTAQVSHRRWPHGTSAHSRVVPKQTGHSSARGSLDGAGWAVGIMLNSDEPPPKKRKVDCAFDQSHNQRVESLTMANNMFRIGVVPKEGGDDAKRRKRA